MLENNNDTQPLLNKDGSRKYNTLTDFIDRAWLDTKLVYNLGENTDEIEQKFKKAFLDQVKIDFERGTTILNHVHGEGREEAINEQINWLQFGAPKIEEDKITAEMTQRELDFISNEESNITHVRIGYASGGNKLTGNLKAGIIAAGINEKGELPYPDTTMENHTTRPCYLYEYIELPLDYEFTEEFETSKQR